MTLFRYLNKMMNEQPKINRGWSEFTPTIDCGLHLSKEVEQSQVKEKSYHSSFYFWATLTCGSDVALSAVMTSKKQCLLPFPWIRTFVYIRRQTIIPSSKADWSISVLFFARRIGLIWLYFIRLWVDTVRYAYAYVGLLRAAQSDYKSSHLIWPYKKLAHAKIWYTVVKISIQSI